ncbi:hypothetical protein QTP88_002180 [Uroleucon formosanum]
MTDHIQRSKIGGPVRADWQTTNLQRCRSDNPFTAGGESSLTLRSGPTLHERPLNSEWLQKRDDNKLKISQLKLVNKDNDETQITLVANDDICWIAISVLGMES